MWPVATAKRLLDTGADDARDDHESKRHKSSDDIKPMTQEPSSGSGVKRSNLEAIRRADAEAQKALKRARLLDERRAAKRASAMPEEMDTMLVAVEAVLTETRETVGAHSLSSPKSSCNEPPRRDNGREFLPSPQGYDSDYQGARSPDTDRFLGEHESLRRSVRGRFACWKHTSRLVIGWTR